MRSEAGKGWPCDVSEVQNKQNFSQKFRPGSVTQISSRHKQARGIKRIDRKRQVSNWIKQAFRNTSYNDEAEAHSNDAKQAFGLNRPLGTRIYGCAHAPTCALWLVHPCVHRGAYVLFFTNPIMHLCCTSLSSHQT